MGKRGEKTRNGNQWTEARFKSFITSALRRAAWPPKFRVVDEAFVKVGPNPKTGRKCKLSRCNGCGELFAKRDLFSDHIEPVVDPAVGFVDWNTYIQRMFIEIDGYQVLCDECHNEKTNKEKQQAKERRSLDELTPEKERRKANETR